MATNKILPWAQTGTANVLSDDAYAADVATGGLYGDGVKTGQASSQQANKTWRQATAPASGLGQFLVDNLSVDVTDADTPATFSSRIANAILKLAQISPFNQSFAAAIGGYRKYAIVSDSSGNFWVSTADQNVTVPGSSGAKWQSLFDGYATQSWSNGQFLRLTDSQTQTVTGQVFFSGAQGFNAKVANAPASPTTGVGGDVTNTWWVDQYYARKTALNAEASSRTNADTNLQNQINNRVLKTGDTSTGSQFTRNRYDNGTLHWAPGWTSVIDGMSGGSSNGDYSFGMWAQIDEGTYTAGIISVNGFQGRKDFRFNEDGNIITPLGTVALQSQLPTSGTITGGTYTKTPMNDGTGRSVLVQSFTVSSVSYGEVITLPISLSSNPSSIQVVGVSNGTYSGDDPTTGDWTNTSFIFYKAAGSNTTKEFSFTVQGIAK